MKKTNYLIALLLLLMFSCEEKEHFTVEPTDEEFIVLHNQSLNERSKALNATLEYLEEEGRALDYSKSYFYIGQEQTSLEKANQIIKDDFPISIDKAITNFKTQQNLRGTRCNDGVLEESYTDGSGTKRWRIIGYDCETSSGGSNTPIYIGIIDYWNEPEHIDEGGSSGGGGNCSCVSGDTETLGNPDRTDIFEFDSEEELLEYLISTNIDPERKREYQLQYISKFYSQDGIDFVAKVNELLDTSGLTVGDVTEINALVNRVYLNIKGQYMMAIFSPDNVATILFFALSGNTTETLKGRFFNVFSRYGAYEGIAGMIGTKSWTVGGVSVTFRGYTTHGTISYGISKGFTPQFIRSMLSNGSPRIVNHSRWGNQLFIEYQGKAIVIDIAGGANHGKIITYLTNP